MTRNAAHAYHSWLLTQDLGVRVGPVNFVGASGLDVWVVDALRRTPHESHFSVKDALKWVARLKPKRTVLTHMTSELDYETLKRELPEGVEPAYDGMQISFS